MNYFDYLRKRFPFYIISGIVFSLALFSLIAVGRYHSHITGVLSDMETIVLNKDRVKKQVREIDDLDRYFKKEFNLDLKNVNMERYVFRALDNIKDRFENAVINVNRFENAGGTQELPVAISTPIRNYAMVLDYVHYLESFTLPDFEIRNMTISKGQVGEVTMNINGSFVMPSFAAGGRT
jgi:hypothetical protein